MVFDKQISLDISLEHDQSTEGIWQGNELTAWAQGL